MSFDYAKYLKDKNKKEKEKIATSRINNIPRAVIDTIRGEFKGAFIKSHTDALMSYLYSVSEGETKEVIREFLTAEQKELATNFEQNNINKDLNDIKTKLKTITKEQKNLYAMLLYVLADRLSFTSMQVPQSPNDVNFTQDGLVDLGVSLSKQVDDLKFIIDDIINKKRRD